MSKMSELHAWIMEMIEDGEPLDEIAYNVTCEYPIDFGDAYDMVTAVAGNYNEFCSNFGE